MTGVRHREEKLRRAFFSARFLRVLDALGYVRFRDWRIYGEEGLAKQEAALWLHEKTLTLEHRGLPLSRYDVEYLPGAEGKKLAAVARPRLFESPYWLPQPRLFDLSSIDWLRARVRSTEPPVSLGGPAGGVVPLPRCPLAPTAPPGTD